MNLEGWESREYINQRFAGRIGKFLEIGAFRPDDVGNCSLTSGLASLGWSGLRVEPNPEWFLKLLEAKPLAPRVELLLGAVEAKGGMQTFWHDRHGGGSTVRESWMHTQKHLAQYTTYYIRTISLSEVLELVGIDGLTYVMIDAEGVDAEILGALPLAEMHDTELISAELGPGELPGYRIAKTLRLNTFWERVE